MVNFTIVFSDNPFSFEKIIETEKKITYLTDTLLLLVVVAFSIQLIDAAQNSNILLLTDGSLANYFRPIWSFVGLAFLIFSAFYALCFFMSFLHIDNRLSRIVAGQGFLIDNKGFHMKNTFNRRIRKSCLWKSNYNLITGINNTGNYIIFELEKKEHQDPKDNDLIFHDAIKVNILKKFNLDKDSFIESLKDCEFINFQE